jgi:hypothetical protein
MLRRLTTGQGYLDHYPVIKHLLDTDRELLYTNRNGGWAIDPAVLAAFRKITQGKVVWSRGELRWRRRRDSEDPTKRMAE